MTRIRTPATQPRTSRRCAGGTAGKESVLLAQRSDLPARPGRQGRAGQDPLGIAPGQQRGDGKAQLIQQACRRELPVQSRAALREHAGISSFGQCAERGRQIHIPLPGDDHVGEVGGLLALERRRFGDGDHDRRRDRGGEEGNPSRAGRNGRAPPRERPTARNVPRERFRPRRARHLPGSGVPRTAPGRRGRPGRRTRRRPRWRRQCWRSC